VIDAGFTVDSYYRLRVLVSQAGVDGAFNVEGVLYQRGAA
jgi:hypothetical protein